MKIPIEIIAVSFTAILGLQGWTLVEIISLKVKMARYEDLEERVKKLESHRR